jgi:hypothetical protein
LTFPLVILYILFPEILIAGVNFSLHSPCGVLKFDPKGKPSLVGKKDEVTGGMDSRGIIDSTGPWAVRK